MSNSPEVRFTNPLVPNPEQHPVLDCGALLAQRFMARSVEALLVAARTVDYDSRIGVYDVAKRYAKLAYEELEKLVGGGPALLGLWWSLRWVLDLV